MREDKISKIEIWLEFEEYNKVEKLADELIEEDPQASYGWYAKGQVFLHRKESEKALKCFERALNTSCQLSEDVKGRICNSLKKISSLHIESISQKVVGRIEFDIYKHKTEFLNSIESLEKRIIEVCSSGSLFAEDITRFFPVWIFNSISNMRNNLLERKKKFDAFLSIDNNYTSLKKSIEMCIDIVILFMRREQNINNKIKGYKMLIDWTDGLISMTQFIPINNGKIQYKRVLNFCNLERKKAIEKRKMIISSLEEIDYSEAAEYRKIDNRIKFKKVFKRIILIQIIVLLFAFYIIGSQLSSNYKTISVNNENNIIDNAGNIEMDNVKTEVDSEEVSKDEMKQETNKDDTYVNKFTGSTWGELYNSILYAFMAEYPNYRYSCSYALYDIEKDGIPELFAKLGNSEVDYEYYIYTCSNEGELSLVGVLKGGHSDVCGLETKDEFLLHWGHQGHEIITRVTLENSELKKKVIFNESNRINYYNLVPIDSYELNDKSGLLWNANQEENNYGVIAGCDG